MRTIHTIAIHCSATKTDQLADVDTIRQWHKKRGWTDIGYHFVIRRDGTVEMGRPLERVGAHVYGHNTGSIGVCWEGGLDENGKPEDNRTDKQKHALDKLCADLLRKFGSIHTIQGHRDFSPDTDGDGVVESHEWLKACPCYDAIKEHSHLLELYK